MRDLFSQLLADLNAQRPVAYCRLVETRGSTPQKAGAAMLVYPSGSQAGTLGGGCVEADVKRQAFKLLETGHNAICQFQLDSDYGWDDGLICGGRMQVVIEPVQANSYFRQLAERIVAGQGITEVIVFDAALSGLPTPRRFLFDTTGKFVAASQSEPDSADLAARLAQNLESLVGRPRPYTIRGVAYLPTLPRCRLVIVGGGHVGKAVADLAADLEFDVWAVDDREEYVSADRFPRAERRLAGPIDRTLEALEITPDTYCLIVTRGHNHDQEALLHLAQRSARYVGLIGSKRKIKLIYENLQNEGVPREALEQVHAPLGIDIGSQTVPEIAISICAELIAHRNRGHVPGRPELQF